MANTILINPVTRISGFLELVQVEGGKIVNARSSGLLFRGFEKMLQGKSPLDAIYFTERICGICSTAHSLASTLALEDALKIQPSFNSRLIREFVHGCEYLQNHIRHFYQYTIPDFVRGPEIHPLYTVSHGDFRLPKELNDKLAQHYLASLEYSSLAHEMLAVLGGKVPHNHGIFVGGITSELDAAKLMTLKSTLSSIRDFVENVMVPDAYTIGQYYPEYYQLGKGHGNLMTYGVFNYPEAYSIYYTKPGVYINGTAYQFDPGLIYEEVGKSWYISENVQNKPLSSPLEEDPYKAEAYTWVKAPRYNGLPMEVGPLARMFISGNYTRGISAMDRTVARALEAKKITEILTNVLELVPSYTPNQSQYQMPDVASGMGLIDTTRGSLGHWLSIEGKKIKDYGIITPTSWNLSPEDSKGIKGTIEAVLLGTPIADINAPVEIGRIVRSFDPCISCATHVQAEGKDSIAIRLM
jgi:hydrogenase large subunit